LPEPRRQLRFAQESWKLGWGWLVATRREPRPYRLVLHDELRMPSGAKLGLGGSACTCVAVTKAVLSAAEVEAEPDVVFKLAATAHVRAQKKEGSGIDVAASTYGGVLWTRRFETAPLRACAEAGGAVFAQALPRLAPLEREQVPVPEGFALVYTGRPAGSAPLVEQIERFASVQPSAFASFVARTSAEANSLRRALSGGDLERAMSAVRACGELLQELGDRAGVGIVTPEHQAIAEVARECGAAAKVSGAGGGDCSIVLGSPSALDRLASALASRFEVLRPGVDEEGVVVLPPQLDADV